MAMAYFPLTSRPDRRMGPRRTRMVMEYLRREMRLAAKVRLERISRWQVTDERGKPGSSLVGVVNNRNEACIFHTRRLTVDDLVHELLHVRHPEWDETRVVERTNAVMAELVSSEGILRLDDENPSSFGYS
jgi:hypothetical protein